MRSLSSLLLVISYVAGDASATLFQSNDEVKILDPVLDALDDLTGSAGALFCEFFALEMTLWLILISNTVMTNQPSGNFLVTAALSNDGSVVSISSRSIQYISQNQCGILAFRQGAVHKRSWTPRNQRTE